MTTKTRSKTEKSQLFTQWIYTHTHWDATSVEWIGEVDVLSYPKDHLGSIVSVAWN